MTSLESILPAEIDPLIAVGLLAISFLGSFITAAFGIGGGVVVLAVLASLLPPAALIPVHGVVQLGSNAGRTLIMRAHISWPIIGSFLIGALIGVGIGGMIVIDLPASVIQIVVGLFVLWTIFFKPPAFLRKAAWIAGGVSSLLTMFFGATGPFVAGYIKAQGFDRMGHVATHAACMTLQHGLKVLAFGLLGFAFGPYIFLIAGMIAVGFLGTIVGRRVLMKIDERLFGLALNGILIALSLRLIWAGATEL
ncbi:MAG: sulfite exporter TauE/SafE family protein [Pseudomonadota bacterium]